jgi:hypothetical protein
MDECEKMAGRALGDIFSGGWASKMKIPELIFQQVRR